MDRKPIVDALEELALLGDLLEENPFKVRAYARAARTFQKADLPKEGPLAPGALEALPGIGKGVASIIREKRNTGRILALEELREKVPAGVRSLLALPGMGPKKIRVLWRDLGVASLGELEYACLENRLITLQGFGPKSQEKVLAGIRFLARQEGKVLLPRALAEMEEMTAFLEGTPDAAWVGEAARFCEVVPGLSLLALMDSAEHLADALNLEREDGAWTGRSPNGLRLRLVGCPEASFGARRVWEASSEPFREALRRRLFTDGLVWDPSGLKRDGDPLSTPNEEAFWESIGWKPIPPECREFPEALETDPDALFSEADFRGSFHVHTDWSDGGASLEAMVEAARDLGWEYIGICDHSVSAFYAGGLSPERLREQIQAIRALQKRHGDFRIFTGIESDILAEGELDYGDDLLRELDLVVASVHSRFNLDEESQTHRLARAVSHPETTFLGHPTGRLLLAREAYAFRWEEVLEAAAEGSTAMELNANPHRLDVDWRIIPELRRAGIPVAVNSDAHSVEGLKDVRYGIRIARKGLLEKRDVVNSLTADEVERYLRQRNSGG